MTQKKKDQSVDAQLFNNKDFCLLAMGPKFKQSENYTKIKWGVETPKSYKEFFLK